MKTSILELLSSLKYAEIDYTSEMLSEDCNNSKREFLGFFNMNKG